MRADGFVVYSLCQGSVAFSPGLLSLLFASLALPVALIAVRWSPRDPAAEKHSVLLAAVSMSVILLLGSMLTVHAANPDDLAVQPPLFWRFYLDSFLISGSVVFAAIQLIGVATVLLHCIRGRTAGPRVLHSTKVVASSLGMDRPPPVVVSRACRSPYVALWSFGTIVLPSAFDNDHPIDQRDVLMHEAAHIARGDCLSHGFCQFAGILLWWNPVYWMVMREMALQRELACDAAVLNEQRDEARYASLLVRIAARVSHMTMMAFASAPMATKSTLRRRLEAIGQMVPVCHYTDFEVRPISRAEMLLCSAALACLVLFIEAVGHAVFGPFMDQLINGYGPTGLH